LEGEKIWKFFFAKIEKRKQTEIKFFCAERQKVDECEFARISQGQFLSAST
jgi:hypothetical protein